MLKVEVRNTRILSALCLNFHLNPDALLLHARRVRHVGVELDLLKAVNLQPHEWHVVPGQLLQPRVVGVLLHPEHVQGVLALLEALAQEVFVEVPGQRESAGFSNTIDPDIENRDFKLRLNTL